MHFVWKYLKKQISGLVLATIMSFLSGLGIIFIMRIFHMAVKNGVEDPFEFFIFIALGLLGFVVFGLIGEKMLFSQTAIVVMQMRTDFCQMIFQSEYEEVEDKKENLFSSLITDINNISRIIEKLPSVNQNLIISIGGIIYLLFISWQLSLILLVFLSLIYFLILLRNKTAYRLEKASRKSWDLVYHNFHDTIFGIKELHLDTQFKKDFIEGDFQNSLQLETKEKVKYRFYGHATAKLTASIMIIGIASMFAISLFFDSLSISIFAEFLTISLFLINPLASSAQFMKELASLDVLSDHIKEIGINLKNSHSSSYESICVVNQPITLSQLHFSYNQYNEDHMFRLGPISIEIPSRQITVIYGSNGSGKSTLSKILAGLYKCTSGYMYYGDTPISHENIQSYRDKIAAIFTDNHLFRNHKIKEVEMPRLKELLKLFEIERQVKITNNRVSSIGLSSGQAKRLALVLSLLKNKEIYIFDEWAANQDSQFKHTFYYQLIPRLKQEGKTIILVTHDNQYFDIGDNLIHLNEGEIV
ncbi:MAG: ATP-binding cassette domain-containing protein [Cyclobacteriaceae bacterium]